MLEKVIQKLNPLSVNGNHLTVNILGIKISVKNCLFVNEGHNEILKSKKTKVKGVCQGENNKIIFGKDNLAKNKISINVIGNNNEIIIDGGSYGNSNFNVSVMGDNNKIHIGKCRICLDLKLEIGCEEFNAKNVKINIGQGFSCCHEVSILAYKDDTSINIGKNCMFSDNIVLRSSEFPHAIFDNITGESFDNSKGISIGDHVWIGQRAFILKNASIPSECVVGTASVVTKKFDMEHIVIAGNPAKKVKENVAWSEREQKKSLELKPINQ